MDRAAASILKAGSVQVEGQVQLEIGPAQSLQKPGNKNLSAPQARIVESQPDFAVIEIICRCGTKTHLRCEYAPGQSAAQAPEPENNPEPSASESNQKR